MSKRTDAISRARLIGGVVATGALAACGGGTHTTSVPALSTCNAPSPSPADRFGVNEIFSNPAFAGLDKQALLGTFDPSPQLDVIHQGYLSQTGQQVQTSNVIRQIPAGGLLIQSPGTYTFGGNISWTPTADMSAAITIVCSNVTLDLAGFALTAVIADKSLQLTGILVTGPVENIAIKNGTVSSVTEYGILAKNVCGLNLSRITITGVSLQNLNIRLLTPSGIQVSYSNNVAISNCSVTQLNVTTDSCAGIQLIGTSYATVNGCGVSSLVNNDGAVQGFSAIGC